MTLWRCQRIQLNTQSPIPSNYHVDVVMEDADNPGPVKYEQYSVSQASLDVNPQVILTMLEDDGYSPNDFALA